MSREGDKTKAHAKAALGPIGLLVSCIPIVLCALATLSEPFGVRALRDLEFDAFQRWSPRIYDTSSPVKVATIDDDSISRLGQWPWRREVMAQLIEKLSGAGAATIVLDVLFSEPERTAQGETSSGDQRVADAIAAGRVVLGMPLADPGAEPEVKAGFAIAGDTPQAFLPRFSGAILPLKSMRDGALGLSAMNFIPDRDLVVRELPTIFNVSGRLVPSIAAEALRVAQDASTFVIRSSTASGETDFANQAGVIAIKIGALESPTSQSGSIRIRYSGARTEREIPAWKILAGEVDPVTIEGKIVLIGATASALYDLRATPLDNAIPGVHIHAEMIESMLAGAQITRPDFMRGLETLLVMIGGFFGIAAASRLPPLSGSIVTAALVGGLVVVSAVGFTQLQQLLDPLWPGAASISAFGIAAITVLRRTERERRDVRRAFAHYLSPELVEVLARDPSRLVLGGETRPITILFSDIRGFTARSEDLSAENVVSFLNSIHTPLTQHVLDTHGTLDKYIGDGMMAFWNAPIEVPDHVRAALRTALRMQQTIEQMNQASPSAKTSERLAIGIGIHTGPACVGNTGSQQRFDYSAIGDTVNTAARIEPLCKDLKVGILVSGAVAEAAPDFALLFVGRMALRGRQKEVGLYALHGDESAVTPEFAEFRNHHEKAVELCQRNDAKGFALLEECRQHELGARYRGFYDSLLPPEIPVAGEPRNQQVG
jgi:adenylate cyclase